MFWMFNWFWTIFALGATDLISFTVRSIAFSFRFVWIQLVSLIWFLQIWDTILCLCYYDQLVHSKEKKLMSAYIALSYVVTLHGSILNVSTVHLNGIWHRIRRYLSRAFPESVRLIQVSLYLSWTDQKHNLLSCVSAAHRNWLSSWSVTDSRG